MRDLSFTFFFFSDTATTEIYTLSYTTLFRSRQIDDRDEHARQIPKPQRTADADADVVAAATTSRSEEHTSELQSRFDLVCRLLLEKKKKTNIQTTTKTNH